MAGILRSICGERACNKKGWAELGGRTLLRAISLPMIPTLTLSGLVLSIPDSLSLFPWHLRPELRGSNPAAQFLHGVRGKKWPLARRPSLHTILLSVLVSNPSLSHLSPNYHCLGTSWWAPQAAWVLVTCSSRDAPFRFNLDGENFVCLCMSFLFACHALTSVDEVELCYNVFGPSWIITSCT